jgi:hypothetical protein
MILVVRSVALICTGLSASIFLGHRARVSLAMPILNPSSFIQLQQVIHKTFVRMMPALILGALVGSAHAAQGCLDSHDSGFRSNNDRHVATPRRTFIQQTMPLAGRSENPVFVTD